MNKDYTHITVVLDHSGSMASIQKQTVDGFNEFIAQQQQLEGKCTVSNYKFSNGVTDVYEMLPIQVVKNMERLELDGMTPLYDGIGRAITRTGNLLAELDEIDRPSKVIVAIMTDGGENSSRTYTLAKIKEMIEHQEKKYNWQFLFMGANQDAVLTAGSMGISFDKSITYAANNLGAENLMKSFSKSVSNYRSGAVGQAMFDSDDKLIQDTLLNNVTQTIHMSTVFGTSSSSSSSSSSSDSNDSSGDSSSSSRDSDSGGE